MPKITLTFLVCCFSLLSWGQPKTTRNWHFGYRMGLNFSSSIPAILSTSMWTLEGTASISDKNTGKTLFYTDGSTVWNRIDSVMKNGAGLKGDESTTQSALIVPMPGNEDKYYIFSNNGGNYTEFNGPYAGINYSIVDLTKDAGLGEVIEKNIHVLDTATEHLAAVKHCNGTDYWIIVHQANNARFNCYLLTDTGLSYNPVISEVGGLHVFPEAGTLKANIKGSKLAISNYGYKGFLELFDFDNAEGLVTNPIHIPADYIYGLSFSPNSRFIYVSRNIGYTSSVKQFDITNWNASAILDSEIFLDSITTNSSVGPTHFNSLQLAPNGSIYISVWKTGKQYASRIANPDEKCINNNCNFIRQGINYLPSSTSSPGAGFPNFIESDFAPASLCDTLTSIFDISLDRTISVYPNPATQKINIGYSGSCNVQLISTAGKNIASHAFNAFDEKTLLLPEFITNGIYLLKIETMEGIKTVKISVQKN